jgi:PAS domain S-box-containing protein
MYARWSWISIALLLGIGLFAAIRLIELRRSTFGVDHTHEIITHVDRLLSALRDSETGQRGFLITGEERYLEPYVAARAVIDREPAVLGRLMADNPGQQERLRTLAPLIQTRLGDLAETISLRREQGLEAARRVVLTDRGRRVMDRIRAVCADIKTEEYDLLRQRTDEQQNSAWEASVATLGGVLLALFSVSAAHVAIRRSLAARQQADEERQWFVSLVENSSDFISMATIKGERVYLNRAGRELVGRLSEEELQGTSIPDYVTPETWTALQRDALPVVRRGQAWSGEGELRHARTGETIPVLMSVFPLGESQFGKPLRIASVQRDIRQQKRAELGRQRSEQRFRAAVDAVSDIVWTNDSRGEMRDEQPGWAAFTGQSFDEYQGYGWTKVIHPEDAQPTVEAWNQAVAARSTFVFEHRVRRHDGVWRRLTVRAVPVLNEDGSVREWVGVHTDITDRGNAEEQLRQSERELRLVTDNAPTWLAHCDRDQRYLFVNQGYAARFGKRPDEVIGRRISELLGEAAYASVLPHVKEVLAGRLVSFEMELPYPVIGKRHISVVYIPEFDDDAKVRGLIAAITDISDRRRAEDAVRESEERFRTLTEALPQMVWTARPDGYLDYYNERWYQFTRMTRGVGGEPSWVSVLHPDDLALCMQTWYKSVRTGQPYQIEHRFKDPRTGLYRWFLGLALPMRNAEGQIVKWIGTCTDIDDQRRLAESLRRHNEELEQFAFAAAHDLQEPLRIVTTQAQLLARRYRGKLDEKADELIGYIVGNSLRMADLIRDTLAYSRLTSSELERQPVPAQEALEASLKNLELSIRESGAVITQEPLPSVWSQSGQLTQIFQNLISNGIKYHRPGAPPSIHISARQKGPEWVFAVSDNGVGIEPQYQERIFGLFRRLHGREVPGTGIGLALCKKIIEGLGGRIWLESEFGDGSTFYFILKGTAS